MATRQSSTVIFTAAIATELVGQFASDTPTFNGLDDGTVHLFKGELVPTPATILADLEAAECDFSGYGAVTVTTMSNVQTGPTQRAAFKSVLFNAASFGFTTENDVAGYWIESDTGVLWMMERFAAPVTIAAPGDFLDLNLFVPLNMIVTVPDQDAS